jgi:threonine dehydratase/serine racemase
MSMVNEQYATSMSEIAKAVERLTGVVHRTPIVTCQQLDDFAGREVLVKCENLQKVGAFKYRGASNAVMQLNSEQASAGVVTHSSGNHAQALALAARQRGIPAWIVMPSNAPQIKQHAVADYGATIVLCEPTLEARETTAAEIVAQQKATFIHPYNNAHVIAGQATVGVEILEQVTQLDAIVAPVGGGGLLAGIALAAKSLNPSIRVYGAEPTGADDAWRSKQAGELIPQLGPDTIADGLLTSLGDLTWPIVRDLVDDIICVDDDEIATAMRLMLERAKLVVEPSGAVAFAAVSSQAFRDLPAHLSLRRVAVIASGGNLNFDKLPWQTITTN